MLPRQAQLSHCSPWPRDQRRLDMSSATYTGSTRSLAPAQTSTLGEKTNPGKMTITGALAETKEGRWSRALLQRRPGPSARQNRAQVEGRCQWDHGFAPTSSYKQLWPWPLGYFETSAAHTYRGSSFPSYVTAAQTLPKFQPADVSDGW